jgi:hypothetical protein
MNASRRLNGGDDPAPGQPVWDGLTPPALPVWDVYAAQAEAETLPDRDWPVPQDEQTPEMEARAMEWHTGLAESVQRVGFDTPDDYLAAVGVPGTWASRASLAGIEAFLARYVAFASEHEACAIALWVAHAHLIERFDVSPILTVTSAEMRSGKTRVLDCLELLVPEPVRLVIPSEAVLYTILSRRPCPTLLLDEADAIFGVRMAEKYEGIRAVLNSGNRRGTPVLRVNMEGKRRKVEEFDVFGPKAVAGIGKLPDTIADRAIPIRMRRRAPDEDVARFRQRIAAVEAQQFAFDWTSLAVAPEASVPEELDDRAADGWEPLLAIADAVGGSWPLRARQAAVALSAEEDDQVSVGIRLLGDIREAFGTDTHVPTGELLSRLHGLDEAPWADWYGKPLTPRALARLLEPYRIVPIKRRIGGGQLRGYFRAEFVDAWMRYLPGRGTDGTDGTGPGKPNGSGDDGSGPTPNPIPHPPRSDGTGVPVQRTVPTVPSGTPEADGVAIGLSVWGDELVAPGSLRVAE